jgi:hypothetical protein
MQSLNLAKMTQAEKDASIKMTKAFKDAQEAAQVANDKANPKKPKNNTKPKSEESSNVVPVTTTVLALIALAKMKLKARTKSNENEAAAAEAAELKAFLNKYSTSREDAAVKIQNFFRDYKVRKDAATAATLEAAAVKLQQAFRARKAAKLAVTPVAPATETTMQEAVIRVAKTFVTAQTLAKVEAARNASKNKAPKEQFREGAGMIHEAVIVPTEAQRKKRVMG